MAALGGLLERAVEQYRAAVREPHNTRQLANDQALLNLTSAWQSVINDLSSMSQRPLLFSADYALADYDADDLYPLPVTANCVKHVTVLDSAGNVLGHVRHLRKYDRMEPQYGYALRGPHIRVVRPTIITGLTTLRVWYEPGGFLPLHYGTLDSTNATLVDQTNGLWVRPNQATLVAGQLDYRPNAYVGGYFRIYETSSAPTGYSNTTLNVDEQPIVDFDETNQRCTLENALLFPTLAAKGGTWKYEIVPSVDWGIWSCVVLLAARETSNVWGRRSRASGINTEYQTRMRTMRYGESTADGESPNAFDRRIIKGYIW